MCDPITEQAILALSHIEDSYETADNLETALAALSSQLLLPATKYNGTAAVHSTLELGSVYIDFVAAASGAGDVRTWLEPCWPSVNITTGLLEKKGISYTNTTQSTQANGGLWTVDLELNDAFWSAGFGYYLSSDNTEERLGRMRKFIIEGGGRLGVQFVQAIGVSSAASSSSAFGQMQTLFDPVKSFNGGGYWQSGAGPAVYLIRDQNIVPPPGGLVNVDLRVRNFTEAVDVLTGENLLADNTGGFATIDLPLSFSFRICSPCSY